MRPLAALPLQRNHFVKDSMLWGLQHYVRNFPVNKGKERLIRALWQYLSAGDYQRLTLLRQFPLRMRCDLTQHIQRDIFFWGTYHYEEHLLDFWATRARTAKVIFDIGANIGIYSLYAAATNAQARIHAFEPTAEVATKLLEHTKINNLNNITVNRFAIGKADELGYVQTCKGAEGANEGMNFVTTQVTSLCQPTSLRSLDSYCAEHQIPQIDLLKMDIEGGEYDALLGMQGLLARKAIGCIFTELTEWAANRYHHSTADIKCLLDQHGYSLYEIRAGALRPLSPQGVHQGDANILAFAQRPESLSLSA